MEDAKVGNSSYPFIIFAKKASSQVFDWIPNLPQVREACFSRHMGKVDGVIVCHELAIF